MAISKRDRKDYEEGRRDRRESPEKKFFWDVTGRTKLDSPAYVKGRRGEELDGDKKD